MNIKQLKFVVSLINVLTARQKHRMNNFTTMYNSNSLADVCPFPCGFPPPCCALLPQVAVVCVPHRGFCSWWIFFPCWSWSPLVLLVKVVKQSVSNSLGDHRQHYPMMAQIFQLFAVYSITLYGNIEKRKLKLKKIIHQSSVQWATLLLVLDEPDSGHLLMGNVLLQLKPS